MKEENRKYAREAMDIVEHAAHKIGSRLPGSTEKSNYINIWVKSSVKSALNRKQRNLPYHLVQVSVDSAMQVGQV